MNSSVIFFWNALTTHNILPGCFSFPWSCKFRVFKWQLRSNTGANLMIHCGFSKSDSCLPLLTRIHESEEVGWKIVRVLCPEITISPRYASPKRHILSRLPPTVRETSDDLVIMKQWNSLLLYKMHHILKFTIPKLCHKCLLVHYAVKISNIGGVCTLLHQTNKSLFFRLHTRSTIDLRRCKIFPL